MKLQKFLVPIDGSKTSFKGLDTAIDLAKQSGAHITCVYVLEILPEFHTSFTRKVEHQMASDAGKLLDKAKKMCDENNIPYDDTLLHGKPGQRITSFAKNHSYDLIIIGSRSKGIASRLLLGSVSNYVVHKCKMPVIIVT